MIGTMQYTHTRAAIFTGRPVTSSHPFDWNAIDYVVVHWPGHDGVPDGDIGERTDIGAYLRNTHERYLADPNRGYSLGYSAAADYLGGTWEIRGDTYRAASNAPGEWNRRSFSINYLTDLDGRTTPQGIAAVNRLIAQVRAKRPNVRVVPHGDGRALGFPDATPTACPGPLRALIASGAIGAAPSAPPAPTPTPTPPPIGGTVLLYKVVTGDSWWRICEKVYADGKASNARVRALQGANGPVGPGAIALHPGMLINVPGRLAVS